MNKNHLPQTREATICRNQIKKKKRKKTDQKHKRFEKINDIQREIITWGIGRHGAHEIGLP